MTYTQLLATTLESPHQLAEQSNHPPLGTNEIEIQSHWFAGHFSRQFQSNHGQDIHIISPGEWNRGAGPDFLDAVITIDGETHKGPIELDLDTQNWDLHRHRENPDFNNVILHIVLNDTGPTYFTRTENNRDIPRITLTPAEVNTALGRPRLSQALARPGLCLTPLAQMPSEHLTSLLKEAALHRAQLKAARFHQTTDLHSDSQALWEHLADALGYTANRLPMRLLAQRLPIQKLLKHTPEDQQAILFGTAGFLSPTLHENAPPASQEWLEDLWTRWWKHRLNYQFPSERNPAWSTRATRPGNHPQRRLAALTIAANHWPTLISHSRQDPPFTKLTDTLSKLSDPFWNDHHTLQSKRSERPIKLIGQSRLQEFLINALHPIHLAKPEHWETYAKIRPTSSSPNQKVKRSCERLFGSLTLAKPNLKYAWQHQALLQIYQDFCLEDLSDCQECPFPQQLAQWKPHD